MKRDELGGQIPRIGIDANNLLTSLLVSSFNTTHMNGNGAIGNLLSTLCRYSCGQAVLIFVFDGHRASEYKNSNTPHGSIPFHEEAKILIRAFGGYVLEAPAEADAQLSWMSDKGILDAVISEDSDMIVRGVRTVLRFNPDQTAGNTHQEIYFDEYTTTSLKNHPTYRLTKGGLLLVALLVGNDYANGINGCGIVTAIQLASCGFGDTLRNGYFSICLDPGNSEAAAIQSQLRKFCMQWRSNLCNELASNSSGKLTRRQPILADNIGSDELFPAMAALHGYLQQEVIHIPLSSRVDTRKPFATEPFMHGGAPQHYIPSPLWSTNPSYGPQPVSIEHITRFCSLRMHMSTERILLYFQKYLWKPVLMQMYISRSTGMPTEIRITGHYKVIIESALTPLKKQPDTRTRIRYITEGLRAVAVSTLSSINSRVTAPTLPAFEKTVIHHEKQAMPWVFQLGLPDLDEDSDSDMENED
ncbi:hypothetical protein AAF712_012307 [Marasmius tenuissimus]|uniref:XPG-I domain-containing protein n=1 Tax=Marasmius tenuissimus TaxID=585030 RepID=A0ABR2ZKC1_9AGAR